MVKRSKVEPHAGGQSMPQHIRALMRVAMGEPPDFDRAPTKVLHTLRVASNSVITFLKVDTSEEHEQDPGIPTELYCLRQFSVPSDADPGSPALCSDVVMDKSELIGFAIAVAKELDLPTPVIEHKPSK